jgi:hypothetical protein
MIAGLIPTAVMEQAEPDSDHVAEAIRHELRQATADLALALGLTRVLTLLPLCDPAVDEVERHIAHAWNALLELRRVIEDGETVSHRRGGSLG